MNDKKLLRKLRRYFPFGFQISQKAREFFQIDNLFEEVVKTPENINILQLRKFADLINQKNITTSVRAEPVHGGQLHSVGIIVDALRYLLDLYCNDENKGSLARATDWSADHHGGEIVTKPPPTFVHYYPPDSVISKKQSEQEYLNDKYQQIANKDNTSAEMILLSLSIANPAFNFLDDLYNDTDLRQQTPYLPLVLSLEEFFNQEPEFPPLGMKLFEALRAPMLASPDSLEGQLEYIRKHWKKFLPKELLEELLLARDVLKEERDIRGTGPAPNIVPEYGKTAFIGDLPYPEPAAFSQDADWMSNVVMIAKSTHVWLDQLSKKYQRNIHFLSDIPDEELDLLANWGFTGLWLIGLWERSTASARIKKIMGNPEALASAYSLYDYVIAADLGGEEAYQNLRDRTWQRGIRLASDMVPNHVGIYSKWVIEHPEWFIQSEHPPFPVYQYNGENLSGDSRAILQIEDGYWEHRDAAVVFKRIDTQTNETHYIYHGNDGTSMPWNDTAQLNFMIPEVREAVLQTILHVARKFSIIRFDAAMTLAKKHYQRLWFPKMGEGGAIPSRAEHGMSREEFDKFFPLEFWREVVDRIKEEVPDTLLLAEAFWLMEGYFVRTLGMHRVYNSAFMNMLKMEDNCKYRMTIKNVLEFSPEVLKRFVNFMNNPDEETAVAQFGKGDKYFGVAVMMVTMPGLPMFGHGQVEGFTEKYGMEYHRAYWDEHPDQEMISRHEREIFPLMQHRRLFSHAENFALYDFNHPEGWIDENVFAYSNFIDNERAIIFYNNSYNTTKGRIQTSTAINIGSSEDKNLIQKSLANALALNTSDNIYYRYREYQSGLEYISSSQQIVESGFYVELNGYQYQAFLDFREIHDNDQSWQKLAQNLNGRGVSSLNKEYLKMKFEPLFKPLRKTIKGVFTLTTSKNIKEDKQNLLNYYENFLRTLLDYFNIDLEIENQIKKYSLVIDRIFSNENTLDKTYIPLLLSSSAIEPIYQYFSNQDLLGEEITGALNSYNEGDNNAYQDSLLIMILASESNFLIDLEEDNFASQLEILLENELVKEYLNVNCHENKLWLNKEQLEKLLSVMLSNNLVTLETSSKIEKNIIQQVKKNAKQITTTADKASYQVEKLLVLLSK